MLEDLVEILNNCIWEDEVEELVNSLSKEEIEALKYYLNNKLMIIFQIQVGSRSLLKL